MSVYAEGGPVTNPSIPSFILWKLNNAATRRARNKQAVRVNAGVSTFVRVVLHLAGFALLTLAGFEWNMIAGLIVAAFSCFALSTLMTGGSADGGQVNRAPDMRTGR